MISIRVSTRIGANRVGFERMSSQFFNQSGDAGDRSCCSNIMFGSLEVSASVRWSAIWKRVVDNEGIMYVEWSRANRDESVRRNGVGASVC
jgi:hypothetical protein